MSLDFLQTLKTWRLEMITLYLFILAAVWYIGYISREIFFEPKPYEPEAEQLFRDAERWCMKEISCTNTAERESHKKALNCIRSRMVRWDNRTISGIHYDVLVRFGKQWHDLPTAEKQEARLIADRTAKSFMFLNSPDKNRGFILYFFRGEPLRQKLFEPISHAFKFFRRVQTEMQAGGNIIAIIQSPDGKSVRDRPGIIFQMTFDTWIEIYRRKLCGKFEGSARASSMPAIFEPPPVSTTPAGRSPLLPIFFRWDSTSAKISSILPLIISSSFSSSDNPCCSSSRSSSFPLRQWECGNRARYRL